eukprot:TRINITY_DN7495_c1_g1_i1.p1 TRINITY_DN7495_c1_g1~~TRINITY_DN7495_c1_g1_i1.p1  ORF type:complete len:330 (+),score=77.63 TRINITY_DN7495_c1_g1_i1:37-990(+)
MAAEGDGLVEVVGIDSVEGFWKVSSLLSEVSVAAQGVDVVLCQDGVKVDDEEGCMMVITQRLCGAVVSWCRAEDNLLRMLNEIRAKGERELTEEEQRQYDELEPRFNQFVAQGIKAIGNVSTTGYIGWLPYSLIMSINPGLLSKRGRRAIEMNSTMPLSGMGDTPLPSTWVGSLLLPLCKVHAIRKIGNLLAAKHLQVIYNTSHTTVHKVRRDVLKYTSAFVITDPIGTNILPGNIIITVNNSPPSTKAMKAALKANPLELITIEVAHTVLSPLFTFSSGGIPAFIRTISSLDGSALDKHPNDSSFLQCTVTSPDSA